MFKLNLLGSPHIQTLESESKWLELEAKKPVYLLIYLAYSGEWLEREKLEFLLSHHGRVKTPSFSWQLEHSKM